MYGQYGVLGQGKAGQAAPGPDVGLLRLSGRHAGRAGSCGWAVLSACYFRQSYRLALSAVDILLSGNMNNLWRNLQP